MRNFVKNINNVWDKIPEKLVNDNTVVFSKSWTNLLSTNTKYFTLLPIEPITFKMGQLHINKPSLMFPLVYFTIIKAFIALGKEGSIKLLEKYIAKKLLKSTLVIAENDNDEVIRKNIHMNVHSIEECLNSIFVELTEDKVLYDIPNIYKTKNKKIKYAIVREGTSDSSDYLYYKNTIYKPMKSAITTILDDVIKLGYNPLQLLYYYLDKVNISPIIANEKVTHLYQTDLFEDVSPFKINSINEFEGYLRERL